MSKQSKTLRQVDEFAATVLEAAAVEIRRLHAQRDALLGGINGVLAAERSEGGGCGGFINTPPTREHQRRVAQAWQELHAVIKVVEEGK